MIGAASRFFSEAQRGIRGDHLRNGKAGAERLAEVAEGRVGHSRHRRDEKIVPQHVCADSHSSLIAGG